MNSHLPTSALLADSYFSTLQGQRAAQVATKKAQKLSPPHQRRRRRRRLARSFAFWCFRLGLLVFIIVAVLSYLTNPFTKYSRVEEPYKAIVNIDGQLILETEASLILRTNAVYRGFSLLKSGYHILGNVYSGSPKTQSDTIQHIIREIHTLRFDPKEPFLISGDHFSVLYPRSLGIFYHSILDPRTALDSQDWENRQKIYLQTTAYALDVFSKSDRLTTTIVPVGRRSVSVVNFYHPPSDTLYSLLYALSSMKSSAFLEKIYPVQQDKLPLFVPQLQTQTASQTLITTYAPTLQRYLRKYNDDVFDEATGLIRRDIYLSSTKDLVKRQSSFYDNVIFWRTHQMAQELGLEEKDDAFLNDLKQRILKTFWLEKEGYFLDDLSADSVEQKYYSSDWLIVLMTNFLDPANPDELQYYERTIAYLQSQDIDKPFGLHYQQTNRPEKQYAVPRLAAQEYGGTAIWSNWGMEYIKALIRLYQVTGNVAYKDTAAANLKAYQQNMIEYRGYPEVYSSDGKMFDGPLYKSVRQTGWVVTYEQAQLMFDSL